MNLNELKGIAQGRFQKQPPSVPMLLLIWAENDSDGELKNFMEPAGISIEAFSAVMEKLIKDGGPDDRAYIPHEFGAEFRHLIRRPFYHSAIH